MILRIFKKAPQFKNCICLTVWHFGKYFYLLSSRGIAKKISTTHVHTKFGAGASSQLAKLSVKPGYRETAIPFLSKANKIHLTVCWL